MNLSLFISYSKTVFCIGEIQQNLCVWVLSLNFVKGAWHRKKREGDEKGRGKGGIAGVAEEILHKRDGAWENRWFGLM